jgi:hypothetical protein
LTKTEAETKHVIDDFNFYDTRKKRNISKEDEGHASKKKKTASTHDDERLLISPTT